jgi:hypothetical protein
MGTITEGLKAEAVSNLKGQGMWESTEEFKFLHKFY